jgi:uncharacterized protein (TIGR02996 family)
MFHEKFEALPDKERELFRLIWYEGLTQKEAANVLDVSRATVRRRWRKARFLLAKAIQKRDEDKKAIEQVNLNEQAFLKALEEDPDDIQLRLVFADYLEERGDPGGELLRLTHTLTQANSIANRPELEARLRTLLQEGVQPIGPFWTNSFGMKFAWIPPGTFMYGESCKRSIKETE